MNREPIIISADTVVRVSSSYNSSNSNFTPVAVLDENLKNHYSVFAHSLHSINQRNLAKYDVVSNFNSLCLVQKSERLEYITEAFPGTIMNQEQKNMLKIISSTTTQRMDLIQFKPSVDHYETKLRNFKSNAHEDPNFQATLIKMFTEAESRSKAALQRHVVWPDFMNKYVSAFTSGDLGFVHAMLEACYRKLHYVVAFCAQPYMIKTLGLLHGLDMVYLLLNEGNMLHVLNSIKSSVETQTLPQIIQQSNFTFSFFNLSETQKTILYRRVGFRALDWGLMGACSAIGLTGVYLTGRPALSLIWSLSTQSGSGLPAATLITEVMPEQPYIIKDPEMRELVKIGTEGGGRAGYHAVKIVTEPLIGAYVAAIEAGTKVLKITGGEASQLLEKGGLEVVRVGKVVKNAYNDK